MKRTYVLLLVALAGSMIAGCNRAKEAPAPAPKIETPAPAPVEPVRVVGVTLGKSIDAGNKVTAAAESFAPNDTIYVSIETQGASPSVPLMVRWTYEGNQLVREESQAIAPTGPATSEFHVSKPDGWPKGNYAAEILLDGVSVRTAPFRVL